jgi:ankyrin repeat protein
MLAVDLGWVEVVESLLARDDLDPNIVDNNGDHVLLHSVFLGRDIVKSLLSRPNVDPNIAGAYTGYTALMKACSIIPKDLDVVEFLLEGIEVNRRDVFGQTALCHAILNGQSNVPGRDGHTPLASAAAEADLSAVNLLLGKEGVDVNTRDNHGDTPLILNLSIAGTTLPFPNKIKK